MFGPYRRPHRRPLHPRAPYLRQILTALLVVLAALAFVAVVDKFSQPGKGWSDTLLVRLIMERRHLLPFFP
ncbi:hypothetical protein [Aminirod propionatiphilus]|uniref:Uncharacterized protein n=1 Tax=Aminirod propionatiphilus TaxID=3415223 RepID=A0ACD1DUC8_9BACT|nr:hypothetical protein KIH16_11975 [Synergistota bacterium]